MSESWLTPVDHYCERAGVGFWAEPLNAISNAAFILAALAAFLLWRGREERDWPGLCLIAVAFSVGIGSFLFHTLANRWSLLADVVPIGLFIYGYFYLAMRRYLGLGRVGAGLATGSFVIFNMNFGRLWFGLLSGPGLNGSVGYIPAVLALFGVGLACLALDRRGPGLALAGAGSVFAVSLAFRSADAAACAAIPIGTHFLWHGLNACVLYVLMRAAILYGGRNSPA
ncbi:hypothetical protein [Microvirga pudoricolor]|uniref:hypothetical protein n=1 Tax=Microvirga pudoricolor TaxID=2778729 RepID=UPI00194DD105|nr:hypothetical protein [Microvirga pudoricolor]MBM6596441.1 hypothetical protein [Microvirga pudoricolor]